MGDSTCLMQQPFCYASGISNESNENNPIHTLGQSISFGRFMSESLAWEKWSSFSHNRYVEEAERYSRPGSVAQKKAFFEAHYKKLAAQKAAAALLEQANNKAQNNSTGQENERVFDNDNDTDTHNSQISPNYEVVVKEEQEAATHLGFTSDHDPLVRVTASEHESSSSVEASVTLTPERIKVEVAKPVMEEVAIVVGNSMKVELQKQLEDVDAQKEQSEKLSEIVTPPILTPILKVSKSDQEVLPPTSNSFKLSNADRTSKFTSTPVKLTAAFSFKMDNIATPMSNKPADKKRSTPRSVTFTPIRELNRLTASVMRKFESTRVGAASSKASKDNLTTLRTPTMASIEMQKPSSLTPLTEKKRTKTPLDLSSGPGNHKGGAKWRLLSGENRMRSPIISSPFSLKTEERAARRKKKLEEKFNANEAQKVQLHTKVKEKTETEIIRKLRQSFCFKARPLPDFYRERKTLNETRKDPVTHSETPKDGRKFTPSMGENKPYLPPNRPVLENSGTKYFHEKSGRTLTHPQTSTSTIIPSHENASPNIIQHPYQSGCKKYKY